jgi:hypothetical protein
MHIGSYRIGSENLTVQLWRTIKNPACGRVFCWDDPGIQESFFGVESPDLVPEEVDDSDFDEEDDDSDFDEEEDDESDFGEREDDDPDDAGDEPLL